MCAFCYVLQFMEKIARGYLHFRNDRNAALIISLCCMCLTPLESDFRFKKKWQFTKTHSIAPAEAWSTLCVPDPPLQLLPWARQMFFVPGHNHPSATNKSSQNKMLQDQFLFQNHLDRQEESLTTASVVDIAERAEEMQMRSSFGACERRLLCRCCNQQMKVYGSSGVPQTTAGRSRSESVHKQEFHVEKMRLTSASKEKRHTFKIWLQSLDSAKLHAN